MAKFEAGEDVLITEGFFRGRIGTVSSRQDKVAGVWINIAATDDGVNRRIWFPTPDVKREEA